MSKIIIGIIVAGFGSLIVSFGISDSCSSEIIAKVAPFLGTLPGLAFSWWARVKQGGITPLGMRKY